MNNELFTEIRRNFHELQKKLNEGFDKDASILMSKYSQLYYLLDEIDSLRNEIIEYEEMVEDAKISNECELVELAQEKIDEYNKTIKTLINKVKTKYKILFDSTNNEYDGVTKMIVEIRAGAGGDEGALFASDLYRMYSMYIDSKGWKHDILDNNFFNVQSGETAIKKIVFEVNGKNIYQGFKYEAGIHKVIRNPITDASDRTHTSSATVAIVPVPDNINIELKDEDLEIITCKSGGAGGQHVNVTDSAVTITHKPTGLVVKCQDERKQAQNKQRALMELKARLYKIEKEKQMTEISQQRREMVGSGDYSSRIRTYNFKKNLFYDHRINYKTTDIEKIMNGDLTEVIEALNESFTLNEEN